MPWVTLHFSSITSLSVCPVLEGDFTGETIEMNLTELSPVGFSYLSYLVTPELTWEGSSEGGEGQGRVQKWLPSIGLVLSRSLCLPTPQGWEDGEEGERLALCPSSGHLGLFPEGQSLGWFKSNGIPRSSLTLLLTAVVQSRLDLLQHGAELANSN